MWLWSRGSSLLWLVCPNGLCIYYFYITQLSVYLWTSALNNHTSNLTSCARSNDITGGKHVSRSTWHMERIKLIEHQCQVNISLSLSLSLSLSHTHSLSFYITLLLTNTHPHLNPLPHTHTNLPCKTHPNPILNHDSGDLQSPWLSHINLEMRFQLDRTPTCTLFFNATVFVQCEREWVCTCMWCVRMWKGENVHERECDDKIHGSVSPHAYLNLYSEACFCVHN